VATFGSENVEARFANNHVEGAEQPILILPGPTDRKVRRFNSDTLHNMSNRYQTPVESALLPDVGHAELVLKIHPWYADEVDTGATIDGFIQRLIKEPVEPLQTINQTHIRPID